MNYQFSSYEVKVEIDSLQELIGMRIGNIHQVDKDTLTMKFWKLGVSRILIVQNGVRFHITDFPREKPKVPPDFCCRLRKLLRFRRLNDIIQPLNDRAVYFCFGDLRLCFELFQGGNIILFQETDKIIQAVLKYHVISGKTIIGVNQPYNDDQFKPYTSPTDEQVHNYFKNNDNSNQKVRQGLNKVFPFTRPEFFISSLTVAGINPDGPFDKYEYHPEQVDIFIAEMRKMEAVLLSKPEPRPERPEPANPEDPENQEQFKYQQVPLPPKPKGYVYTKGKDKFLSPFPLAQYDPSQSQVFDTFDKACDEFWSVRELERAQKEHKENEAAPDKKVQSVKKNFDKKRKQFQDELDLLNRTGHLIQANATQIEQCRNVINSFIANRVRWDEIRMSIRAYQECGNELASMIDKVDFEKSGFYCLVNDEEGKTERIFIELKKTAYANASAYFDKRAVLVKKLEGANAKEEEVLKKVEKDAIAAKKKVTSTIQERRKTWWFERFHWFITTENYLVISGRDKVQNEVLVAHYLKKDDIYLHAEIHGAASVIIKNPTSKPVSPISLEQAAEFAVARSSAWKSNEPCNCFWVHADQVKKNLPGQPTAPKGTFYIVGEKNMMTMTMPQMGLGILFHVTEQHVADHANERKIRVDEDEKPESEIPKEEGETKPKLPPRVDSAEIEAALPFPQEKQEDIPAEPEKPKKPDNEEEENSEDEEISDEELMKMALTKPEDADVAARRLERKEKRNRPKPEKKIEEGVQEIMQEEGIPIDLDTEGINALTGEPLPTDEFFAAYVMCAPVSALLKFKYKVKFVPGETKKGKAWPVISNYFQSMKAPSEQTQLIKLIPDNYVTEQMPFDVRLQLGAGGQASQNKNKNKGKQKGKK
ncbi:hypothetical protein TVAG_198060 [Trichomonas vaginalis G3]|uniref:Ribosome quality control complex subunit 2 n=1 Tax=Trichomonas vaginalis (strain ATCC PRA-98 / G3) TaxID=412133 RepID=A2DDJ3_TRIV3|nr:actin binding [Trichomonas vaginalis G3]EAY21369.1 hypothetical protein TVAG_198060 [Trichomonas vaginalis G3]KAI5490582.1 actin binding [Trichomonas vaginalis G3]|eukprot:XP_001582355.1 hypothetical protein [Trichomonas vaginalis G3]